MLNPFRLMCLKETNGEVIKIVKIIVKVE